MDENDGMIRCFCFSGSSRAGVRRVCKRIDIWNNIAYITIRVLSFVTIETQFVE